MAVHRHLSFCWTSEVSSAAWVSSLGLVSKWQRISPLSDHKTSLLVESYLLAKLPSDWRRSDHLMSRNPWRSSECNNLVHSSWKLEHWLPIFLQTRGILCALSDALSLWEWVQIAWPCMGSRPSSDPWWRSGMASSAGCAAIAVVAGN